jgi:ribonuclease HII
MIIGGVDEAGRGCVLGPLCIALVCGEEKEFKNLGLKDSKLLTREKREQLFPLILEKFDCSYINISANELNELMVKHSLNEIEAMKSGYLLDELKIKPKKIVFDSPDNIALNYTKRIKKHTIKKMEIVSEHKADFKYPVVSAASIVAKVIRDREIDKIKEQTGYIFSSGYPSDEATISTVREMLKTGHGKEFIRMRWSTVERILASENTLINYF